MALLVRTGVGLDRDGAPVSWRVQPATSGRLASLVAGRPLACIWVPRESEPWPAALGRVVEHTPEDAPLVVAVGSGVDLDRLRSAGEGRADRTLLVLEADDGGALARALNLLAELAPRADLALISARYAVGPRWLERLSDAARSDTSVATAPAVTHDRALPSGPQGWEGAGGSEAPEAGDAVAEQSLRLRPPIVELRPHCFVLRRPALQLAGGFDAGLPDAEAVADWSRRISGRGLLHVLADDVFVERIADREEPATQTSHGPGPDLGSKLEELQHSDERAVLRRAVHAVQLAMRELSVTIDGRGLNTAGGGTATYVVELVLALARRDGVRLRVVMPPDPFPDVRDAFGEEPAIETVDYEQAVGGVQRTDVVHRPQQVFTSDDLALLRLLGERIVVTHQDLIAYRLPGYHATVQDWDAYRRTTRLALGAADGVVFFSEHARDDALREDLIDPARSNVVGIGGDQIWRREPPEPRPPAGLDPDERGFLLCLGSNYAHKNRPFAIELAAALAHRHGWDGRLVLAGAHVAYGSSRRAEAEALARSGDPDKLAIDLGPVDESGRAWLYERAAAVAYPSVYEGFGIPPFEAARAGIPCLYAPQASLVELAGPEGATLVPWDAEQSADAVLPLLSDGPARAGQVAALRDACARTRWSEVAANLVDTYRQAIRSPARMGSPSAWDALRREQFLAELGGLYDKLREGVGDALPLAERDGLLTPAQQRGLMRVAGRGRALGKVALAPFSLVGRLGRRGS